MEKILLVLLMFFNCNQQVASTRTVQKVEVQYDKDGAAFLTVDGEKMIINGMNWDYIPIGRDAVSAEFWKKSDEIIKAGLEIEMSLLKDMNVNVIRQYSEVPPRWIQYIYENYGIYTILNHSFGRYGVSLEGVWTPVTNYADGRVKNQLLSEITKLANEYKNTPGLLMYLLGNENNYGLFWQGAETENIPNEEEKKKIIAEKRGRPMYQLMNEASKKIKTIDTNVPIAICNGDVLFIDIIAEECTDVDIFGTNVYRGSSFGDLFQVVKEKLNKPVLFTEFGADAFNAISNKEDQADQAFYMIENWKEIYANVGGLGKANNCIGGCTFQFSDGWWKYGFDNRINADKHDNNASWSNGGYGKDYIKGKDNMNEEWFGVCAKGKSDSKDLATLYPRAAYFALKEAHQFNPYAKDATLKSIEAHFSKIQIEKALQKAEKNKAILESKQ